MSEEKNSYDASSIRVLEGLEAVRKRPAMYIGSTDEKGLNHLALEIIDNCIDEAMAGYCNLISVDLSEPDIISVYDNGRGFPVDNHPDLGIPGVTVALTMLHAGGKFDDNSYKVSGGLHGVGVSVVNALAEWLIVEVRRDGKIYRQKFSRGDQVTELEIIGETDEVGTTVTFKPDAEIFETVSFDRQFIQNRLKELAFLNRNVKIRFTNQPENYCVQYLFKGGIQEYLENVIKDSKPLLDPPMFFEDENDGIFAEVAFTYLPVSETSLLSFVNSIHTRDGGTHVSGFRSGILRVINEKAKMLKYNKEEKDLFGSADIQEGLSVILNTRLFEPQFEGQTKGRLGNSKVRKVVDGIVYQNFSFYLDRNPGMAKKIIERCLVSKQAREDAQKARERVLRKSFLSSSVLPGKLADCSERDPEKSEIFIVEGNSAGGNAKQARNRHTQAILPLRGKILNVEKASLERILSSAEIQAMISALGTGIGDEFDYTKLRYHKVFIMTDADVDGAHIRTLLLTFFYRYMRDLVDNGNIYIAQPPLYLIMQGKNKETWCFSDEELAEELSKIEGKTEIQRYKGLGEMSAQQLSDTTMDEEQRKILRVNILDAEKADQIFTILMGEEVQPRKEFIQKHAKEVTNLDI
ncbi:MAG: DNA topoisomerase (ATP-hydrolyzing) subunit B [Caldisericia bacterium]|nr:DNA topoisomerase (ATP-hydrolyzing) subunit B [Caldisericia bacterium]